MDNTQLFQNIIAARINASIHEIFAVKQDVTECNKTGKVVDRKQQSAHNVPMLHLQQNVVKHTQELQMDKGIRSFSDRTFMELLPQRAILGNKLFRKTVRTAIIEAFGATDNSASTHYNHSFQQAKAVVAAGGEAGEAMKLALGDLGRAEGKNNGGRKRKSEAPAPSELLTKLLESVVVAGDAPAVSQELVVVEHKARAEHDEAVVEAVQAEELQNALDISALESAEATAEVANPEQAAMDAVVPTETTRKRKGKKVEQTEAAQ